MKKKNIGKILSLTFLISIFLTSCDTDEIGERISTTVNNMLPNLWFTLLQLGLFIITFLVIFFIAYKPLKKKLNNRADYIDKNIKDSEDKKKEAEENLKKSVEYLEESKKNASKIIQTAQKNAETYALDSQRQLNESIEKQKVQAHKDIEAERNKMLKDSKEEIIKTAISTSKEILKREITKEDNDQFVDEFVNELIKEKKEDSNE